jgi:hypothetical protein
MISAVQSYAEYIETTLFPKGIEDLKKCADLFAVNEWRTQFCSAVYERKLGVDWDAIRFNPQDEERKEDLTMSQRFYLEAVKLESSVKKVN